MTRLLNVNSYHYRRGGSEVVYLEHALMMEGRGFECGYFSMQHPRNEPTPWSRYFIDEIEFGHDYSLAEKLSMAGKVVWSFEARAKLARLLVVVGTRRPVPVPTAAGLRRKNDVEKFGTS